MLAPGTLLSFSTALAQVWFAGLWQGLVLVAVVALAMRLLPGLGASRRSAVWVAVLALLVSLHFSTHLDVLHHGNLLHKRGQQTAYLLDARWTLLLAAVWAALSGVRAIRLSTDMLRLRGLRRRALPFAPELVQPEFAGKVFLSSEVTRPCVVGAMRPRILLPADLPAQLTLAELRQVLLHEQEHIRRGDPGVNLAQKVLLIMFPLSPALLVVDRRLCVERELACDDQVMRVTGARKGYAICLARIAEHRLMRQGVLGNGTALVLGAWHRRPELVRRVERILRGAPQELNGWRAHAAAAILVGGAFAGSVMLLQAPSPVRFGSVTPFVAESDAPSSTPFAGSGRVQEVKAVVTQTNLTSLPRPRLKHARVRRIRLQARPRVLMARASADVYPRQQRLDVAWLSEERVVVVPAVLYVVPTAGGWLVIQL